MSNTGRKNMVILITGASHTGKTLLAQKMLEKYKYPYLSIDHLKMGLIRSGQTELTPCDDDKLTDYLWPIVREIIKTAIENDQHLIVEGCYIPFDWQDSFDKTYLDQIRYKCLIMSENSHTPVSFWLLLPLRDLLQWIKDNNEIIKERSKQK